MNVSLTTPALAAFATLAVLGSARPTTAPVGPRALAPTFVPLEIAAFPRPAAQACRDNRRVVRVRPPSGLARALESARPGTTVLAAPGTYVEHRGGPQAIAWTAANVCLRAQRGPVVLQAAPGQKYGISVGGSDAVIQGVVLRGFVGSIALDAPAGRTLRRVTIEHVRVERPRGEFRDGIAAYGDNRSLKGRPPASDGLLLLDVSVSGTDLGVSCNAGPCAHWWLERVRVDARRGSSGNSGADAFAIEDGRQIAIVDSTFAGASADGIDTKADDVVVLGARVLGVERNGIKLWRGGDVIDSVVDGSGADASLVGDAPGRYRYLHVLVTHHGRPGDTHARRTVERTGIESQCGALAGRDWHAVRRCPGGATAPGNRLAGGVSAGQSGIRGVSEAGSPGLDRGERQDHREPRPQRRAAGGIQRQRHPVADDSADLAFRFVR